MLDFFNADAMNIEHEFPLDYIFFGSDAFGVLDDGLAGGGVGIDKVGDVFAGTFTLLGWYKNVWDLLTEI